VRHLFDKAIAKRSHLLNSNTNALRLLDGSGDGLADHFLECYADKWIVATRTGQIHNDLYAWLKGQDKTVYWKQLDKNQKLNPTLLFGPPVTGTFFAKESDIQYHISLESGYSQGIFLDQRDNRSLVKQYSNPGETVLNTFAYTGAFSVCAALSGATTTTLDLSQPYLDWAKNNFKANQLDPTQHHFCKGDTIHWLKRFARQNRTFHGIILDPPTFSRDQKGNVFRVEKDYHTLIELAMRCLAPSGWILASTNCRKMNLSDFTQEVNKGITQPVQITEQPMPEEYTGEAYLKSLWLRT